MPKSFVVSVTRLTIALIIALLSIDSSAMAFFQPKRTSWISACGDDLSGKAFTASGIRESLAEYERLGKALFKNYPPVRYQYVFVGRSPAVLAALFYADPKTLKSTSFLNLSLGQFLEPEMSETKASQVFNEMLGPTLIEAEGRELVFIDFADRGLTFQVLSHLIELNPKIIQKTKFAVLADNAPLHLTGLAMADFFTLSPRLQTQMKANVFKELSPFDSWGLISAYDELQRGRSLAPGDKRAKFLSLVEQIKNSKFKF